MRDNDKDIDDILAGVGIPPAPEPALELAPKKTIRARRKSPPAEVASSVEELSARLKAQLDESAATDRRWVGPEATKFETELEHLAPTRWDARILDIGPDEYHERPGLSSSIASVIIEQSPLHAWACHPSFGGHSRDATKEMDRGAVVHAIVLGRGKEFAVLDCANYKTSAAKAARDRARADGLIPILRHQFEAARTIAEQVTRQLTARGLELTGQSEVAIEWSESTDHGFLRCRAMLDHLRLGDALIVDLKITGDSSPPAVERSAENFGYALQAAAYRRAIEALQPASIGRVDFLLAFAEPTPPYALNLSRPDGMFRELGERRWARAVDTWARCIATKTWPGFGTAVNYVSVPPWALKKESP